VCCLLCSLKSLMILSAFKKIIYMGLVGKKSAGLNFAVKCQNFPDILSLRVTTCLPDFPPHLRLMGLSRNIEMAYVGIGGWSRIRNEHLTVFKTNSYFLGFEIELYVPQKYHKNVAPLDVIGKPSSKCPRGHWQPSGNFLRVFQMLLQVFDDFITECSRMSVTF
jgi:hypothetical protein